MASGNASTRAGARLAILAPAVRTAALARAAQLTKALDPSWDGRGALAALADRLRGRSEADLWLTLSAFAGQLPRPTEVRRLRRQLQLDSGWDAVALLIAGLPHRFDPRFRPLPLVLSTDQVHVDVTGLATVGTNSEGRGVGRRLLREWSGRPFIPVTWSDDGRSMRGITAQEATALEIAAPARDLSTSSIIPLGGYVLLGTTDLPRNAERLLALGQYSGIPAASIGYGIGPLVHGERYAKTDGAERFTWHLAAQRSFPTLLAVGDETPAQYAGWKRMLTAVGIEGPVIRPAALPTSSTDEAWSAFAGLAAAELGLP